MRNQRVFRCLRKEAMVSSRIDGDREGRLDFILNGIVSIAEETAKSARDLLTLSRMLKDDSAGVSGFKDLFANARRPVAGLRFSRLAG